MSHHKPPHVTTNHYLVLSRRPPPSPAADDTMSDNNMPSPTPPDANHDVQMPPRHMVRIDQPLSYYKTERLGRVALPIDNTTNPTARHDRNSSSLIAHIIAGLPNVFQNNVQVQMPPDLFSVSYERDRNFGAFIAVMPISFATFLIENGNHIGYFNIRGTDGTAYKLHYCEYIASPERRIGFKQNTVNWYWINLPPACVLTTDELRELMAKHVAIAGLKQNECERPLERLVFFPLGSPRHTPPQPQCRAQPNTCRLHAHADTPTLAPKEHVVQGQPHARRVHPHGRLPPGQPAEDHPHRHRGDARQGPLWPRVLRPLRRPPRVLEVHDCPRRRAPPDLLLPQGPSPERGIGGSHAQAQRSAGLPQPGHGSHPPLPPRARPLRLSPTWHHPTARPPQFGNTTPAADPRREPPSPDGEISRVVQCDSTLTDTIDVPHLTPACYHVGCFEPAHVTDRSLDPSLSSSARREQKGGAEVVIECDNKYTRHVGFRKQRETHKIRPTRSLRSLARACATCHTGSAM